MNIWKIDNMWHTFKRREKIILDNFITICQGQILDVIYFFVISLAVNKHISNNINNI